MTGGQSSLGGQQLLHHRFQMGPGRFETPGDAAFRGAVTEKQDLDFALMLGAGGLRRRDQAGDKDEGTGEQRESGAAGVHRRSGSGGLLQS